MIIGSTPYGTSSVDSVCDEIDRKLGLTPDDDLSSEDVYLNVRWMLGRADGILPASSVVAYDQICINESGIVAPTNLSGRPEIIRKEGNRILMGGQMPYKGLQGDRASS